MKKLWIILIISCFIFSAGCKKDAQVNEFMKEYESVINAVAEKLNEDDADAARKVFDTRKGSLRAKWEKIKYSKPYQISPAVQKKMNAEPEENFTALVKSANEAIKRKPADEQKIKDLVNDVANTVRR